MAVKKKPAKSKSMEMSPKDIKRDKGKKEMPMEFMEYTKKKSSKKKGK